ncbi:hypothetical protein AGMMS49531_08420 [Endomicrobiia bacterium]|nr:hypothetical protein AGMMS49531_08420 [Endomicrobiia bacterium]
MNFTTIKLKFSPNGEDCYYAVGDSDMIKMQQQTEFTWELPPVSEDFFVNSYRIYVDKEEDQPGKVVCRVYTRGFDFLPTNIIFKKDITNYGSDTWVVNPDQNSPN